MPSDLDAVLAQAMKLPLDDRAKLAEALQQSVVEAFENETIESAWLAEAKRRSADRRSGRTTTRPWKEIQSELRGILDDPAA